MKIKPVLSLIAIVTVLPSVPAVADVISDWNEKAVAFVAGRRMPPAQAERVMAMVHVAMFDAVNSIDRRYRPYLVQLPANAATSREAAATAAAGKVLVGLDPQAESELKVAVAVYLGAIADGDAKSDGTRLGEAVAARILETRAKDGAEAPEAWRPKTNPGTYVPTATVWGSTWPKVGPSQCPAASSSGRRHQLA